MTVSPIFPSISLMQTDLGINTIIVIGVILACAGFTLLLLPFNLAASGENSWHSAQTIVMIVVGILLLVLCGLYERYLTPKPFIPYENFRDRNVWGASVLSFGQYISL